MIEKIIELHLFFFFRADFSTVYDSLVLKILHRLSQNKKVSRSTFKNSRNNTSFHLVAFFFFFFYGKVRCDIQAKQDSNSKKDYDI